MKIAAKGAEVKGEGGEVEMRVGRKSGMVWVWAIALGTVVAHVATGWRYGFNRDELMALEDARHLAWGYVQYPPMTAFFGWMALKLFGTSLVGFRFFAAAVQALALVLTGMMAKEIGKAVARESAEEKRNSTIEIREELKSGGMVSARGAELAAGSATKRRADVGGRSKDRPLHELGEWAAVIAAGAGVPFCLGGGALMQYISFDYICWVLVAYGMVRVLQPLVREARSGPRNSKIEDGKAARWWVVVGLGIGLGMMAKYTMGLLAGGVVVGVLATDARRFLRSGWLWMGVLVAVGVWAPNVWWQWERGFPSVDFLRFLHARDVSTGVTDWFFVGQLELTMLALPLALAGLWFYFCTESGKAFRAMGWMYVVPLALLVVMRGRDYYLAPAYPMLYAAGAVWIEKRWRLMSGEWRESAKLGGWIRKGLPAMLAVDAMLAACVALPIMPVNSRWWRMAAVVDTVLPEELGWEELTATVARARDRLPESDRGRLGILARNYGEMGALNLYGERYGLPRAISGVNSSWERGYGNPPPETVIAVGYTREFLEEHFASCELVGHPWNRYGVANEEVIEDPDIFVCRGLKGSWEEFWKKVKLFA